MAKGKEGIKQTMETKVRKGQIWADNDKRSKGRTLEVISVTGRHAECKVLTHIGSGQLILGRRTTHIRLDRMRPTSTGYRLISEGDMEKTTAAKELTEKQARILTLIARGLTWKEVARTVCLSPHTIRHHMQLVTKKLGAKSGTHAVAIALTAGMIRLPTTKGER